MKRQELLKLTHEIANPVFDGRATGGIRTRRSFEAGTVLVIRRHSKTGEVVSVAILWDEHVHTLHHLTYKLAVLIEDINTHSVPVMPTCVAEAMLIVDPYFFGGETSAYTKLLDMLLAEGAITPTRLIDKLEELTNEDRG